MSEHALTVLDFHRALEQVAGRAASDSGRAAVLSLRPRTDREWVERELTRVWETVAFLGTVSQWSLPEIPDCLPFFERLGSLDKMIGRPEDVASAVLYAVSQPPNVNIADIVVRPAKQMPLP